MAGPRIIMRLVDPGALGVPVNNAQVPIYIGVCSAGPMYEVTEYTRDSALRDEDDGHGHGHLVDVAAFALANGAESVKVMRVLAAVPGTKEVDGTDWPITVSSINGTALNFLRIRIEILTGTSGAVSGGNVLARYSIDAWDIPNTEPTYSQPFKVAANGEISIAGTGLVVDLDTAQTPVAGDDVEIDVTPAHYDATGVGNVTPGLRSPLAGPHTFLCYTGDGATASGANTLIGAMNTQLTTLFSEARFVGVMTGLGLDTDTAARTAIASTAVDPPFLSDGYGFGYVNAPTPAVGRGRYALREHDVAAVVASNQLISTDLGRTGSGAVDNLIYTDFDAALEGDAMYDARISVFRTWMPAAQGTFIQRQRLLSSAISNFITWPHAAVMLTALRGAHRVAFLLVLESLRRNPNGTLDARDNADIKAAVTAELNRLLLQEANARGSIGHVSALGVTVSKTTLLPSIGIAVKLRPLDYAEDIEVTLEYADEV